LGSEAGLGPIPRQPRQPVIRNKTKNQTQKPTPPRSRAEACEKVSENNMSPIAKVFNKYEKFGAYHWIETKANLLNPQFNPLLSARYQKIANLIPENARTIIDVGCGDGYLVYLAHAKSGTALLHGLEYDEIGLRYAKQKLGEKKIAADLIQGDIFQMPYESNIFDVVLNADVIEHLDNPEDAVREMHRIMRPGGLLLLSTPQRRANEGKWDALHVHEFSTRELKDLCEKYFKDVRITACWPRLWINGYLRSRFKRLVFRVISVFGWNPALQEGDAYTGDYQQLIVRCEK